MAKHRLIAAPWLVAALLLAACTPPKQPPPPPPPPPPSPPAPTAPIEAAPTPPPFVGPISQAHTAREYRQDGARHIYKKYSSQIYKGRMRPLLYAIGVLDIYVGRQGEVLGIFWKRAPTQAPEVMQQIETMVRSAAPFPAPVHIGPITYTDTWLWDKSGKFQLDTLTEGQN